MKHQIDESGNRPGAFYIALTLAIGLATALNLFVVAVLYEALFHTSQSGISENATQILTGWGGGFVGIVGAYVGYQAARTTNTPTPPDDDTNPGDTP